MVEIRGSCATAIHCNISSCFRVISICRLIRLLLWLTFTELIIYFFLLSSLSRLSLENEYYGILITNGLRRSHHLEWDSCFKELAGKITHHWTMATAYWMKIVSSSWSTCDRCFCDNYCCSPVSIQHCQECLRDRRVHESREKRDERKTS